MLQAIEIAAAKTALPFGEAFFRGVLCNVLVCMAVWMAMAGRSVMDKAVAIVPPVAAFVAAGFEHSIANMYWFPLAMLLQWVLFERDRIAALRPDLRPTLQALCAPLGCRVEPLRLVQALSIDSTTLARRGNGR